MLKVNSNEIKPREWQSPKGKYGAAMKEISVALGREPESTDLIKRHPFDVAIVTLPPGKAFCPLHTHASQWEFYHVISGQGVARELEGETTVGAGDAFVFKPGEAHQIRNDSDADFVYCVIADNPLGEHCYYPDSKKWLVQTPTRAIVRSDSLDYLDGEE